MKLGQFKNISCEYEMQEELSKWLKDVKIPEHLFFKDEVHVKEVSRRADFLIAKGSALINIEAKCHNFDCMIKQMNDHARYCDYCFAFIPDFSVHTKKFKADLLGKGYGLIVYNHEAKCITEVLEAHVNKGIDRKLKKKYHDLISEIGEQAVCRRIEF